MHVFPVHCRCRWPYCWCHTHAHTQCQLYVCDNMQKKIHTTTEQVASHSSYLRIRFPRFRPIPKSIEDTFPWIIISKWFNAIPNFWSNNLRCETEISSTEIYGIFTILFRIDNTCARFLCRQITFILHTHSLFPTDGIPWNHGKYLCVGRIESRSGM